MLTKVVAGGNMRRDDNAFIVPETAVGLAFELADIHVQGGSELIALTSLSNFSGTHFHQRSAQNG